MENKFGYMYVMDFSDATISEVILQEEDDELDGCELLDKYGFKDSTCNFMITENRIVTINTINDGEETERTDESTKES